jgi:hypothetical protein
LAAAYAANAPTGAATVASSAPGGLAAAATADVPTDAGAADAAATAQSRCAPAARVRTSARFLCAADLPAKHARRSRSTRAIRTPATALYGWPRLRRT